MPLYLSASAIKDYLDCPQRFHYRTSQAEQAEPTDNMVVGTMVHYAIEHFWDNQVSAFEYIKDRLNYYKLGATKVGKAHNALEMFFSNFSQLLTPEDSIEFKFKLKLEENVYLVGKIDRIANENIFDWKSGSNTPKDISNDIQFIIYQEAYTRIFGKPPRSTLYASLNDGKLIALKSNLPYAKELFGVIIPSLTRSIRAKEFYRKGIFTRDCFDCPFQKICFQELEDGMDCGRTN